MSFEDKVKILLSGNGHLHAKDITMAVFVYAELGLCYYELANQGNPVHKDTVRATTEDFKYQILAQPFDEKALEAFNNCLRIIPDDALLTSLENTSMFKKIFCSTRSLNDDSCLLFV